MKNYNRIVLGIVIIFASIIMIFILRNYMPLAKKFIKPTPIEKKKIVIFTSSGGRGHISATEAIQEYLGDTYEIKVVYPVREILQELDFIHKITGGSYNAEDMYNNFLARKQIGLVKTMVYAGQFFMSLQRRTMERLIDAYVESEAPDMIISVMPNVNGATYTVANKHKIPFWIIPTDFDLSGFLFQIYKPQSEQFFVNYPLADSMVVNTTRSARLKPSQSTYIGMPVREQFLKEYNIAAIKEKFGIQPDKPVIMVMMGGRGAKAIEKLAAQLVQLETPVHLLLCIGKQTEVKDALAALNPAPGVTLSIIEFTPHIAELMAISDLFVSKSGGQSVSEALYMGLPMVLDATDQAVDWEQLNRKLVEKRGFGMLVKRLNKLVPTVKAILDNPSQLAEWKTNIKSLHLPNPCTGIRNQVTQLIGK